MKSVKAVKTATAANETNAAKAANAVGARKVRKAARAAGAAHAPKAARQTTAVATRARGPAGRKPKDLERVWTPGSGAAGPAGPPDGELVPLNRARDELGLDYDEFDVAVQIGEVPTVVCGPGQWKVPARELARLRGADGHPQILLDRLRLVTSTDAAELIGIGRDRFVRLARAGYVRPVRWYVNRYRALVWMYLARELPEFAEEHPALLHGRLPAGLREALEDGEDLRARGWRERRVAQLTRDAPDAWEEAAVWAALLGPEVADQAVPDPYERAHLRRLRAALPPGRPGPASPELIRRLTTADHPDEIALALVALADALGRARVRQRAPHPPPPLPLQPTPQPVTVFAVPQSAAGQLPAHQSAHFSARPPARPPAAHSPHGPGVAAPVARRGLRRLLRGRRSAADPAEQPFLHDGDEKPPLPVEDLAAGQTAGAGRDG